MKTTPITLTTTVQEGLAGFAMKSGQGGEHVPICQRGFFTSDDGPEVYTYLDEFYQGILGGALRAAKIDVADINDCLVNIVDGTKATLWINHPTVLNIVAKGDVQAGQEVTLDQVADVRGVALRGIDMPKMGAIAYTFQNAWRRGFYFDFSMIRDEPNRPLPEVRGLLGSLHAALMLRDRIRMEPATLAKMFEAGWFPFIRLPQELLLSLYRHFGEGWDPKSVEDDIVRDLSPAIPQWIESWRRKPPFAQHIDAIAIGARHFAKQEYHAASMILLPKIEGIMRTLSLGTGAKKNAGLQQNLVARVRASVSGTTAFMPEAFVDYLQAFYNAGFDLETGTVPPSRHSFMHGVGPDAIAGEASFALRLLLTIDQLFFYT